jgi:hypothetical protein
MNQIFIEAKTSVWKMAGLIGLGVLTLVSIVGFVQLIINIISQYIK